MSYKNIVIYGASGWLGRITINYILKNHPEFYLILVTSKEINLSQIKKNFKTINFEEFLKLKNEQIDYFLNFSFITQEKLDKFTKNDYIISTNNIINSYSSFMENNIVKKSLLTSSGAVYWKGTEKENLYAIQKYKQENYFKKINFDINSNFLIARIYGVIGSQYDFNKNYAFTNFIKSGIEKKPITITSKKKVLRSYLYFENLLDYFFNKEYKQQTLDTWDTILDIYELAEKIAKIFNVKVKINPEYFDSLTSDEYLSKDDFFKKIYELDLTEEKLEKIIMEKSIF